jgi:tellurite resistance protein TerC
VPEISTPESLGLIVVVLAIVTVASLVKARKDRTATAHAGSITGRKRAEQQAEQPDQMPSR